jgi:RNA polymerase sigma factor for flagellar operon FliA
MKIESKGLLEPRVSRESMDRYMAIVRRHAFRMLRRLPSHILVEDLISAGLLGLADALNRADGSNPDKFEAYAAFRIRGAMIDELRTLDPLSRDQRSLKKSIVEAMNTLTVELGRAPEEIEIAQKLGLPLATFRDQLGRVSVGAHISLETCGGDELDGIELRDDSSETADKYVHRSERREKLASVLGRLPERLQEMVRLYYDQDFTFRDIGQRLGITESRVCQLHAEAILRLKASYAADTDHDEDSTNVRWLRTEKELADSTPRGPLRRAG